VTETENLFFFFFFFLFPLQHYLKQCAKGVFVYIKKLAESINTQTADSLQLFILDIMDGFSQYSCWLRVGEFLPV